MTGAVQPGYVILDPRPNAVESPYTFFLPHTAELAAIVEGDDVKLMFEYAGPCEKWDTERMWVCVDRIDGEAMSGWLDNEPDEPTSPLEYRDRIDFSRHQIISISPANPETMPRVEEVRDYWERCLVEQCVLDGTEPVEYIYREEPDLAQEGDTYPDSGWRIRGRQGDASDEDMDNREVQYVALGAVLNQDDSWLLLIDEPIGTRMIRDFETGEYLDANEIAPPALATSHRAFGLFLIGMVIIPALGMLIWAILAS